jgi:hypothetical protein
MSPVLPRPGTWLARSWLLGKYPGQDHSWRHGGGRGARNPVGYRNGESLDVETRQINKRSGAWRAALTGTSLTRRPHTIGRIRLAFACVSILLIGAATACSGSADQSSYSLCRCPASPPGSAWPATPSGMRSCEARSSGRLHGRCAAGGPGWSSSRPGWTARPGLVRRACGPRGRTPGRAGRPGPPGTG